MTPAPATAAPASPPAGVRAVEAQSRQRGSATEGAPDLDFAGIVDGAAGDGTAAAAVLWAAPPMATAEAAVLPMPDAASATMPPAQSLQDHLAAAFTQHAPDPVDPTASATDPESLLALLDQATSDDVTIGETVPPQTADESVLTAGSSSAPSGNTFAGLSQALLVLTQRATTPQQDVVEQGSNGATVPVAAGVAGPDGNVAPPISVQNLSPIFAASLPRAVSAGPADDVPVDVSWTVGRRETHFAPSSVRATADRLALLPAGDAPIASSIPSEHPASPAAPAVATTMAPAGRGTLGDDIAPVLAASAGSAQQADDGAVGGPSVQGHPAHQVFERLVGQLSQTPTPTAAPATSVVPFRDFGQFQPLRSLDIALEPQGLGTVTLKLAVKNDLLRIEVVAANQDTAVLLERDRDMLSSLVKSAGYQVDQLAIRHVETDRGLAAQPLQPTADAGTVRPAGQSGGANDTNFDGRSGGGQPQGDRPQGGERRSWRDAADVIPATPATKPRSVAAGIYI